MSSDNTLFLRTNGSKYFLYESFGDDWSLERQHEIGSYRTLKQAILAAQKYITEKGVEYNLRPMLE
ncbi:MAG: hypothetical protein A2Z24_00815 [Candidatus Woykebacteria bacterium RBG_16_44_10]|uniref:DUF1508 domain-containing protein n=1 Tax=Candidatus Woykebacteria bacterium RBG_16_44_10 TaxID=1802597 RepID=A0A1G1WFL1_9BACT|nr:MAG: hypothetical protein A2Z24_00815 [Candidatus Woykebacteria bacterium RBG_16_44_10]